MTRPKRMRKLADTEVPMIEPALLYRSNFLLTPAAVAATTIDVIQTMLRCLSIGLCRLITRNLRRVSQGEESSDSNGSLAGGYQSSGHQINGLEDWSATDDRSSRDLRTHRDVVCIESMAETKSVGQNSGGEETSAE